jgi:hypothetical protein
MIVFKMLICGATNQTKPKTKSNWLYRPSQPKQKNHYIVHMKSAKGEPMDANMPAVRFKINQPRVSLWTPICPRYDLKTSAKGEPMDSNMPAVR